MKKTTVKTTVKTTILGAAICCAATVCTTACGSTTSGNAPSDQAKNAVDYGTVDGVRLPEPAPDPADFVARVSHPYFPLRPGSRWVYDVTGDEGHQTDTVTVLRRPRLVAGVAATVVHDIAVDDGGRVLEDTDDWFAQDRAGNVWYLGEDTTAYEKGDPNRSTTKGSWTVGVDGAAAGIVMPAHPDPGDAFEQEYRKGTAEDRARILSVTASVTVPSGRYTGVVRTEDVTPLEPGTIERKYYARGVGDVREETIRGGDEQVELVSFTRG